MLLKKDGLDPAFADANASVSVSGSTHAWMINASAFSTAGTETVPTSGDAGFVFDATFGVLAGQQLSVLFDFAWDYPVGDFNARGGDALIDMTIYRDGLAVFAYDYSDPLGVPVIFDEAGGAEYRIAITGFASSSASGAGGGDAFGPSTASALVNVQIVPAPLSAGPLAVAGLAFAARRRR